MVFGRGFIGTRLKELNDWYFAEGRIGSVEDIVTQIEKHHPEAIVNAIGFAGRNNVDECNDEMTETIYRNSYLPLLFMEAAMQTRTKLVHLGTGCMFTDSEQLRTEEDVPNYTGLLNSRTKAYADLAINNFAEEAHALNIRFRVPIDSRPHTRNLLDKLRRFDHVTSEPNSVTWVPDLAAGINHLLDNDKTGTYNIAVTKPIDYPTLLSFMNEYEGLFPDIVPGIEEERTKVRMDVSKIQESGYNPMTPDELFTKGVDEYYQTLEAD